MSNSILFSPFSIPLPMITVGNNYTFRFAYKTNPGIPTPLFEISVNRENERHGICYFPEDPVKNADVIFDIRGPESNSWVYTFGSDHKPFVSSNIRSTGCLAEFLVHRTNDTGSSAPPVVNGLEYGRWNEINVVIVPHDHPMGGKVIENLFDIDSATYLARFQIYLLSFGMLLYVNERVLIRSTDRKPSRNPDQNRNRSSSYTLFIGPFDYRRDLESNLPRLVERDILHRPQDNHRRIYTISDSISFEESKKYEVPFNHSSATTGLGPMSHQPIANDFQ